MSNTYDLVSAFEGSVKSIDSIVDVLTASETVFRPHLFGESEGQFAAENRCDDIKKFGEFRSRNKLGYFLRGPNTKIDVTHSKFAHSKIFIEARISDWAEAKRLVSVFAHSKPIFGYSCHYGERRYRNKVVTTIGSSTIEGWVGRDVSRHLPGLYWSTYIDCQHFKTLGVDIGELQRIAMSAEELDEFGLSITMYDQPEQWEAHSKRLDEACANMAGVYSGKVARDRLSDIKDQKTLLAALHEFR